ncbi:MAG: Stf0 family sulfotransferase [Pseudomonadota bacterium]
MTSAAEGAVDGSAALLSLALGCNLSCTTRFLKGRMTVADKVVSEERIQSYMICTTPRSGSTLLCKLLQATGVAGCPNSHFHAPSVDAWLSAYGLQNTNFASSEEALQAVFRAAIDRGTGSTDVFGLRMQRGSFEYFMGQLTVLHPGVGDAVSRLRATFGPTLFIHLTRSDKLGQAISRLRAEQSGLWHKWADGRVLERQQPVRRVGYDARAIADHIKELTALDTAWNDWFTSEGIEPLRIQFDALCANPQGTLANVLSKLDLDPRLANKVETPTARLADAETREWRDRFAAES